MEFYRVHFFFYSKTSVLKLIANITQKYTYLLGVLTYNKIQTPLWTKYYIQPTNLYKFFASYATS